MVLDRIAEIAPILDRTAAESERLRTLCGEATEAMHAAGLFGMWVPHDAGGFDIDLVTQVDAIVELARADMSACWTLMIGNTVTASMAASLPAEGFAEVFVGERLPVAAGSLKPSGRAERVAGGYRVTGQWGFGSGIRHAEWIVANCLIEEKGQTRGISLVVPIAEVDVHDDWHVAGLCGTGSCTYAVTDVFVPDRRRVVCGAAARILLQRQCGPTHPHRTRGGLAGRCSPGTRRDDSCERDQTPSLGSGNRRCQPSVPSRTRPLGGAMGGVACRREGERGRPRRRRGNETATYAVPLRN